MPTEPYLLVHSARHLNSVIRSIKSGVSIRILTFVHSYFGHFGNIRRQNQLWQPINLTPRFPTASESTSRRRPGPRSSSAPSLTPPPPYWGFPHRPPRRLASSRRRRCCCTRIR